MKIDNIYSVKKEIDKDQFIRRVILKLASSPETPVDVAKAEFGEVKESVREVILCTTHVEMDYSGSIGYDRQETYWTKEKKRDSNGNEYYEDVQKTRTVTDWRPHNAHTSGDHTCAAFNESGSTYELSDHRLIGAVVSSINKEDIVEKGETQLCSEVLPRIHTVAEHYTIRDIKWPGDHHKDESYKCKFDDQQMECFKLPFYEVDFVYDDKTYHASGFACNESMIQTELPANKVDFKATAAAQTKKDKIIVTSLWGGVAGMWVLALILIVTNVAAWSVVFPIATYAAAVTMHFLYKKKYNSIVQSLATDSVKLKLETTQESLKERNYAELTNAELDYFGSDSQATHSAKKFSFTDKKMILFIALGAFGLLFLIIWACMF